MQEEGRVEAEEDQAAEGKVRQWSDLMSQTEVTQMEELSCGDEKYKHRGSKTKGNIRTQLKKILKTD